MYWKKIISKNSIDYFSQFKLNYIFNNSLAQTIHGSFVEDTKSL